MAKRLITFPIKPLNIILASLMLLLGWAQNSWAQQGEVENQDENSTVVYTADYFAENPPVSANDMLNRIPGIGVALRGGGNSGGRGLGSGSGSVLINGRRVSGKGDAGRDQLRRMSADQVKYIEIIRGGSEELGISGAGQIVNVVLVDSPSRSSTSVEVSLDHLRDGSNEPSGQMAFSGQSGAFNYLFNVEAESRYSNQISREVSFNPDLTVHETKDEERTRDQVDYQTSINLGYAFDRSVLQFNALAGWSNPPTDLQRITTDIENNSVEFQREENEADRENWEVGGDYEYSANNGDKYRVLFIVNDREFAYTRERYDVFDDTEAKDLFLLTESRDRERIIRSSYNGSLSGSQGIEVGVERAQTIRDSNLRQGLDTDGTPSAAHGGLVPVDISNSSSTVEEIRYEWFAVHNWQINQRMSLESSMILETSTIEQSGDVQNKRDFEFLRPKLDFRFDITRSLQLRAGIEKTVSQLSFSDFSATVDNSDEDQNTQAGNPDIAQEQSWRYEINLEYRLPNDIGVINSQFYYRDLEDVIDRIDVSPTPDDLQSARGNIGDGKRYGVNFDVSARLGFLGLPNALLTTSVSLRDSEVIDPFLGVKRRVRNNGRWSTRASFRHDVTKWGMSYGFFYNANSNDGTGRTEIDIIDIETRINQPNLSTFIEKKAFGNFTFRFETQNTLDSEFCRIRTRFVGATADGIVEEIEDFCSGNGLKMALKIKTTF